MYVYKKVIIGQLASGLPVLGFKLLEKIKDIDVGKAIEYKEKELDTFVTNFELPKDWCHNYKGLDIIHYTEEYFRNFFSIRKVAEEELLDNYVYLYGKNNDVDEYFVLLDGGDNLIPFKELDNLPTIELLSYFGEQKGCNAAQRKLYFKKFVLKRNHSMNEILEVIQKEKGNET